MIIVNYIYLANIYVVDLELVNQKNMIMQQPKNSIDKSIKGEY